MGYLRLPGTGGYSLLIISDFFPLNSPPPLLPPSLFILSLFFLHLPPSSLFFISPLRLPPCSPRTPCLFHALLLLPFCERLGGVLALNCSHLTLTGRRERKQRIHNNSSECDGSFFGGWRALRSLGSSCSLSCSLELRLLPVADLNIFFCTHE